MVRIASGVLAAAGVVAFGLAPSVASAATHPSPVLAQSTTAPAAADPDTTVTFTVTTGALGMTAPASVNLGSGAPGTTISAALGTVTVTDDRALLAEAWNVVASATDWTTGAGTPHETIPAGDVGYDPGTITPVGTITVNGTPLTALSATPTRVVAGTAGSGDNSATWSPTIAVAVPAGVVGGLYTGTLTQSLA